MFNDHMLTNMPMDTAIFTYLTYFIEWVKMFIYIFNIHIL